MDLHSWSVSIGRPTTQWQWQWAVMETNIFLVIRVPGGNRILVINNRTSVADRSIFFLTLSVKFAARTRFHLVCLHSGGCCQLTNQGEIYKIFIDICVLYGLYCIKKGFI